MIKKRAAITAVHGAVPDYILTNKELETIVDTNDEWITTRTGIKERRIEKDTERATSDLGAEILKGLCEKRGISPAELDLVVFCTITADQPLPAAANMACAKAGAVNAWGFDLAAACSGFVYGLSVGSQFIETGRHKKVAVVGIDLMSRILDYEDRTTCIIFGDGGGAALLEPNEEFGIVDFVLKADGNGEKFLNLKAGGSAMRVTSEVIDKRLNYLRQEGTTVFKHAVSNMAEVSLDIMDRNSLTGEDIDWFVPHQANLRIIDSTANRMGVPMEKVMVNIEKYGNTTAGTIPLCLWNFEDKLKKGDNVILAAFGGGFTWGSLYLTWAYNS